MRKAGGLVLGILAFLASLGLLILFGNSDADPTSLYPLGEVIGALVAYAFGVASLAVSAVRDRWLAVGVSAVAMVLLVVLAFMFWLYQGIDMEFTKASTGVLVLLAGVGLFSYLRWRPGPGEGDTGREGRTESSGGA